MHLEPWYYGISLVLLSKPLAINVPGDHFLLLVGGVASTAQQLGRRGEEVEAVVLKVLVDQRQENLPHRDGEVSVNQITVLELPKMLTARLMD